MGGRLFLSDRIVFELVQGFPDFEAKEFDCPYESLVQKEATIIWRKL